MHVELIVYTLPIAGKQVFVEMSIAVRDVGHAQSMIARSIVTDALHILVKRLRKHLLYVILAAKRIRKRVSTISIITSLKKLKQRLKRHVRSREKEYG